MERLPIADRRLIHHMTLSKDLSVKQHAAHLEHDEVLALSFLFLFFWQNR